jgi:flagellar biosynthesis chaperone FliJ
MQLEPKEYEYKRDEYPGMHFSQGKQFGFIAQDMEKVFPELSTNKKKILDPTQKSPDKVVSGYYTVNYIGLIPVLVKAIQEQQQHIEQLEKRVDELEKAKELKR